MSKNRIEFGSLIFFVVAVIFIIGMMFHAEFVGDDTPTRQGSHPNSPCWEDEIAVQHLNGEDIVCVHMEYARIHDAE